MRDRLDKMTDESERLRDNVIEAVVDRLVKTRAKADEGIVERIESRIEDLGERLTDLAKQAAKRESAGGTALDDHMRDIDERFAAVERASEKVKEDAVATLIDRMADRDAGVEKIFAENLVTQLDTVTSKIESLEERLSAAGGDEQEKVRVAIEELTSAAKESDESVQSFVSAQLEETHAELLTELNERFNKRDTDLSASFRDNFDEVRSSVDELASRTSAQLAAMQVSLASGVDSLRDEKGSGVNVDLVEALESRVFTPLNEKVSDLREQVDSRHEDALSAVAAADERGNALAERLEQLAESFAGLANRVDENAAAQTRALETLGERLTASSSDAAEAQQAQFSAALEQALDKIEKTMHSATAKPIEISAEATDVLLNKIFDAGDVELRSNLDQLDVDTSKTTSVKKNLGRLRNLRNAKAAQNNGTDDES